LLKLSASPFESVEYGAELVNLNALLTQAAVEITTNEFCRILMMG
jgi:hypothetical protein